MNDETSAAHCACHSTQEQLQLQQINDETSTAHCACHSIFEQLQLQ